MSQQALEELPVFSFSTTLANSHQLVDIDYQRLSNGIAHLGISAETASDTAVHFADLGKSPKFGVHYDARDRLGRLLVRIPFVNGEYVTAGFQPHQHAFTERIVINAGNAAVEELRAALKDRHDDINPKKLRGYNRGDLLSMILAHELGHEAYRGRRRQKVESQVDAYLADCINSGQDNPWRGVIKLLRK